MHSRLRAALVGVGLTLFAVPAHANCSGGPFAGPYIGASLGVGYLRAEQTSVGEPNTDGTDASVAAGVHAGYNIQCGALVAGLEADFNYVGLTANSSWPDPIYLRSEVDWFGTVRGRLGAVVHPGALVYVTGGLAYADLSHRLSDPTPPLGAPPFSQTDSNVTVGWTVGGGIELLHSDRWLLRGEVLYVDLGEESRTYTLVAGCASCTGTAHWDDSFWVARLGLSLKLQREERLVPLK